MSDSPTSTVETAKKTLVFLTSARLPLTPENYNKYFQMIEKGNTKAEGQRGGLVPDDRLVGDTEQALKDLISVLMDQVRGSAKSSADYQLLHRLVDIESQIREAQNSQHLRNMKQEIQRVMDTIQTQSKASAKKRIESLKTIMSALLDSFKQQLDGGDELLGELESHASQIEDLKGVASDADVLAKLPDIADGVRQVVGRFEEQQTGSRQALNAATDQITKLKTELAQTREEALFDELTGACAAVVGGLVAGHGQQAVDDALRRADLVLDLVQVRQRTRRSLQPLRSHLVHLLRSTGSIQLHISLCRLLHRPQTRRSPPLERIARSTWSASTTWRISTVMVPTRPKSR